MLAELVDLVRARQVRPRELVERSLARIGSCDGPINAVVALRAEEALEEADQAERSMDKGEHAGPLAGIPALVKDIEDVRGMRTTFGSRVFAHATAAQEDGLTPARLRAAGAIVVGKTNCPEFAFESYTANPLFGITRNPWALDWTPGGSSGGSAAALAAGMTPIATATDGGGSIRIPAAFCGLLGLKPTTGLVPRRPIPAWIDLSTDGPLATSSGDLRLLLDVVQGPLEGDPIVPPQWSPAPERLPRRLLAAERFFDWGPLEGPLRRLFRKAVDDLSKCLDIPAEPLAPSDLFADRDPDEDWYTITGFEQAYLLGQQLLDDRADLFDPRFHAWMNESLRTPMAKYLEARRRRFDYVRRLDELTRDDAVLVMPVTTLEGILADGRLPGAADIGIPPSCFNTTVPNLTAHPALSLPAGFSPNGVPFGVQVVGPRWADDMLLNTAALWEDHRPWPRVAHGHSEFAP